MAAVAQRARVSTKTICRLIPNKADLLTRVVSDPIGQFVLEIEPDALDALALPDALERMLLAYGTLVLSERTIAMHRLVIRECAVSRGCRGLLRSGHHTGQRRDGAGSQPSAGSAPRRPADRIR
jgi:AcrR family transcriptional regulator